MRTTNDQLINELLNIVEASTATVNKFKTLSANELNYKKDSASWSVLECIEHLNLYGDFYLPEIEKRIALKKTAPASGLFKPGLIGNYFANLMKAGPGKMKKMRSPGDKDPAGSQLTAATLDRFLKQQVLLTSLLNKARETDLVRTKASISLTRFMKLRLGDTFRFFVYHIERHVAQAGNVIAGIR